MHSRRQPQLDRCIQSASPWEESGQALFSVQTLVLRHCSLDLDQCGCGTLRAGLGGCAAGSSSGWKQAQEGHTRCWQSRKWEIVREMRSSWCRLQMKICHSRRAELLFSEWYYDSEKAIRWQSTHHWERVWVSRHEESWSGFCSCYMHRFIISAQETACVSIHHNICEHKYSPPSLHLLIACLTSVCYSIL